MELKEFASLIAEDAIVAKNTLSYLIGNGRNTDNWGKALINLYISFDDDIKKEKKAFFPIIMKYFASYNINEENFVVYKEYESLMSAQDKQAIKNKNPDWNWSEEASIVYKNSLEFSRAIMKIVKNNGGKISFVNQYEDQFRGFLKKDKKKVIENFYKNYVWRSLINEGYVAFKQFCDKYDFSSKDILFSEELVGFYGLKTLTILNDRNIDALLEDIQKFGKDNISKVIPMFYVKDRYDRSHAFDLLDNLLLMINDKQIIAATKYYNLFKDEFLAYAKNYKVDSLNDYNDWLNLFNKRLDCFGYNDKHDERYRLLTLATEKEDFKEIISNLGLFNDLNNLPNQGKIKKHKI